MKMMIVALLVAATYGYEIDQGVIVGTDATFDAILAENQHVLVEFYAPWCGHCKSLAPEYAKAALELAAGGHAVKLVKVDATVETKSGERFDISGYPTLKFFTNGKAAEFNGGRTAAEIVSWLKKKTGPVAQTLDTVDAAKKFVDGTEIAVIGFFADATSAEAKAFLAVAGVLDMSFGITSNSAVASEYQASFPAVVLLKKFDEGRVDFSGAYTEAELTKFIAGNQLPLVIEFTDTSAAKIFGGEIKSHLLLFVKKSDANFAGLKGVLGEVAKESRGEVLFIFIDADVEQNLRILEFFGLAVTDVPAVRLINIAAEMAKFKPSTTDITVASLTQFVNDYKSGNLKQHLKSEPTPAGWDAQPVKVLTGENFAEVALNPAKNVLVEFYAPWCGHCKQLVPIWDALAEKYEQYDNIVIAKMDSTLNEVDGVKVTSFPTIKFFPAGEASEALDYSGARTLVGFADFLKKQTGKAVKLSAEEAGGDDEEEEDEHAGHDHGAHGHHGEHGDDRDEL